MTYFDRFTGQIIAKLPRHMDLGRFAVIDKGIISDLTNADVGQMGDYVVRESLFEETNQNIHDLLQTIAVNYVGNINNIAPIIQKFNIEIKEFEKLLNEQKSHLRAIVANPHSLLDKNTMKVNIGRAKRISTRSYQYLSHHSEDWEKMTILSPKPMKILHEELTIDYAVYENLLLKAFLHEAIKYLNKRVKETADITKFFLSIFDHREFENVWAEKIDRTIALVGRASKSNKSKDSGETNRTLSALKSELVKLEHAQLFDEFPKHAAESIVYHDSNVLNSHKHYKYLKVLWLELKKIKEQTDSKNPFVVHQDIMDNMRIYVEALFTYSLRIMGFKITGKPGAICAIHDSLPEINMNVDEYGIIHLATENVSVKVISLGGIYDIENTKKLPQNTICFCFYDYQKSINNADGIYYVNPIDANSIESSGLVLRKLIIKDYAAIINKRIQFKPILRDFVAAINCDNIIFDNKSYTFSFSDAMPREIEEKKVIASLKEFQTYKQRSKREQDELVKEISTLVCEINNRRVEISESLVCPKCGRHYRIKDLRYLVCDCGFVCDVTDEKARFFHQHKESSYSNITEKGWGMDLIN